MATRWPSTRQLAWDAIRASFRRLATLCPDALFPEFYFVIGAMSAGGATSSHGMLIGVEMNARDEAKRAAACTIMLDANPHDLLRRSGYIPEH